MDYLWLDCFKFSVTASVCILIQDKIVIYYGVVLASTKNNDPQPKGLFVVLF